MRSSFVLLVAAVLAFSGCLGGDDAPAADDLSKTGGERTIDVGDRPDPTFEDVTTGPAAAPDLNASLEAPPRLIPGEWWRIRFESPLTGEKVEFVRVVADVDGETYVVGMPHEGWYKEAVVYHAPGFGDVNADLSYDTHNVLFRPVVFPLTDEQTWTTRFSGGPEMTASVTRDADGKTATVTFTAPNTGVFGTGVNGGDENVVLELVYDATVHEVREFRHSTLVYSVVEHGYGFEGWITVPRGEHMAFFHGRIGPAADIGLEPAAPVETVTLDGGYNRVTFIQVAQTIGGAPGVVREMATAPDGTEFVTEAPPTGGFVINFFEHPNPDGDWDLTHVAGGAAVAFIEGIAYHQYDIHLPDGRRRADHAHEVIR